MIYDFWSGSIGYLPRGMGGLGVYPEQGGILKYGSQYYNLQVYMMRFGPRSGEVWWQFEVTIRSPP